MKKFLLVFLSIFLLFQTSYSMPLDGIHRVIMGTDLDKETTVSVSVKDIQSGKTVYDRYDEKLLHPASSLKIFTLWASINTLGSDYTFDTKILKDSQNNIYIKLGADPMLKYSDLRQLVRLANISKINKIYIDDTIIDNTPYPTGWLTDDFQEMAMISPYTLNQNKVSVKFAISPLGNVECYQPNAYKFSFINELQKGKQSSVSISKEYGSELEIINAKGTVSSDVTLSIPVNNPKFHFIANLKEILEKEKIKYDDTFGFKKAPENAQTLSFVSHSMEEVAKLILQNSNNFASEVVFRIAGGKFKNKDYGTTKDGIDMFYNYYNKMSITENVKITDASGVSRYDLLNAKWVSDTLVYLYKNSNIKDYMATPDVGTLSQRLRHLKGKLWAKTGTLNGISTIEGYIISKNEKERAFIIIIQNFNRKPSYVKSFEDDLIDAIYKL